MTVGEVVGVSVHYLSAAGEWEVERVGRPPFPVIEVDIPTTRAGAHLIGKVWLDEAKGVPGLLERLREAAEGA